MLETRSEGKSFWDEIKFGSKGVSWETEKAIQERGSGKLSAREALERLNVISSEISWLQTTLEESDPEKVIPSSLKELLKGQLQDRLEKKRRLVSALDATVVDYSE